MADMLEGGLGQFPLEQWFYEMPVCTRLWTTATVATSILVQCHIITPFQLFYSLRAVFVKGQVRTVSAFTLDSDEHLTELYITVLAPNHKFLLLRTPESRPPSPRLLSPTILASS